MKPTYEPASLPIYGKVLIIKGCEARLHIRFSGKIDSFLMTRQTPVPLEITCDTCSKTIMECGCFYQDYLCIEKLTLRNVR